MSSKPSEQTWPRPVLALTAAFVLALVLERLRPWPNTDGLLPWLAMVAVALLAAHGISLVSTTHRRWPILSLLLFFTLGLLAYRVAAPPADSISSLEPYLGKSPTLFLAEVAASPDPQPNKTRLPLHLLRAYVKESSVPLNTGAVLTVRDCHQPWLPGQLLLARLQLKRIHGFHNPGGYNYERAQAERGFLASAFLPDDRALIPVSSVPFSHHLPYHHGTALMAALDRFRLDALQWLKTRLPADTAAIYAALLLGFQNQVPRDVQEHWNRAGVTHILSISGQHLGMVAMAAFWLLRHLVRLRPTWLERWGDQRLALWGAVVLALLYAAVGGLSLPAWRSAIMLTLFFAGIAWGRPTDSASALSLAALLILVLEPHALWTASFQLSFAAIAGIFLVYPRLSKLRSWLRLAAWQVLKRSLRSPSQDRAPSDGPRIWHFAAPFADAFWVSLAVNVMVLPLVIYHFHGISLVGFLANTILVPLTGFLVLPLGLTSLALFAVNQTLANLVLVPGGWTVIFSEYLIEYFSQRSWAYHWVGDAGVVSLVMFYGVLGTLLSAWRWRTRGIVLAGMALIACLGTWGSPWGLQEKREQLRAEWRRNQAAGHLQVLFVDVAQGSSTLLGYPDGTNMLVDGGGFHDDAFDVGRNVLAPLLWYLGIDKLDTVVLSHDHPDHGNGLRFILSHFRVGSFWESGIRDSSKASAATDLAAIAASRAIPHKNLEQLQHTPAKATRNLHIRHPSLDYLQSRWDRKNLNNVSLVIEAVHGDTRVLLPGDIDQTVEEILANELRRPGRVLLAAPHHGSQHSSGEALLDSLKPETVVFSCGYGNFFGFPHETVLQRLRDRGAQFHRTDQQGAVWAVSDGHSWRFAFPAGTNGTFR